MKLADTADYFKGLWIDTVGYGRAMPRKSFYGPQIAERGGEASLLLQLNYSAEDKEQLLVHVVQVGIDLFGLLRGGSEWPGEGGGMAGRKWIITFAGLMLGDKEMHSLSVSYPDRHFHEDDQTVFCPVEFLGKKYESGWTGAKVIWAGHYCYVNGVFMGGGHRPRKAMDHYGPVELFHPADWPSPWSEGSEGYRRGTTSGAWVGQALAARLMQAEKNWNHEAFFAYVDRWMTEDDTVYWGAMMKNAEAKLAAATEDGKKQLQEARDKVAKANKSGTVSGALAPLVKELWTTYRNNLPGRMGAERVPSASETWK